MSAIVSRIYTTTLAGVITPQEGTGTIFRLLSDGLLYCMLPDRTYFPIGESSGVSTSNIIIQAGEGDIPLTGTETELYAIQLSQDVVFNEINFPNLTEVFTIGALQAVLIESVSLPSLVSVEQIDFEHCNLLTDVNLSSLSVVGIIDIKQCPIENFTVSGSIVTTDVTVTGAALTQQSVDDILIALNTGGSIGGSVDLSGGTSASPSPSGIAAGISLSSKGWTLRVN